MVWTVVNSVCGTVPVVDDGPYFRRFAHYPDGTVPGHAIHRRCEPGGVNWLISAYAIALAVASIRLVVGIFFATSRLSGLKPVEFFGIAFWIGFVIHLILAEAWIYRTRGVVG